MLLVLTVTLAYLLRDTFTPRKSRLQIQPSEEKSLLHLVVDNPTHTKDTPKVTYTTMPDYNNEDQKKVIQNLSHQEHNEYCEWYNKQPESSSNENLIDKWLKIRKTPSYKNKSYNWLNNGKNVPNLTTEHGIKLAKADAFEIIKRVEKSFHDNSVKGYLHGSLQHYNTMDVNMPNDIDLMFVIDSENYVYGLHSDNVNTIIRHVKALYGNNCFFGKVKGGLYFEYSFSSTYDSRFVKVFNIYGHHFIDILIIRKTEMNKLSPPVYYHECLLEDSDGKCHFKEGYEQECSPKVIKDLLSKGEVILINGPDSKMRQARIEKAQRRSHNRIDDKTVKYLSQCESNKITFTKLSLNKLEQITE